MVLFAIQCCKYFTLKWFHRPVLITLQLSAVKRLFTLPSCPPQPASPPPTQPCGHLKAGLNGWTYSGVRIHFHMTGGSCWFGFIPGFTVLPPHPRSTGWTERWARWRAEPPFSLHIQPPPSQTPYQRPASPGSPELAHYWSCYPSASGGRRNDPWYSIRAFQADQNCDYLSMHYPLSQQLVVKLGLSASEPRLH